jgi:NAD(P)-dependent dehydrogenase (short-subunit alcohol dehydrogenase family)
MMSKVWLIAGSSRGFGRQLPEAIHDTGDSYLAITQHCAAADERWASPQRIGRLALLGLVLASGDQTPPPMRHQQERHLQLFGRERAR